MKNTLYKEKLNIALMWVICTLVNIKSAFTDYSLDTGYAYAIGYRRLLGDNLFGYMREPHQTSAFFISLLMRLYSVVFPDLTGIVIVTNIISIIVYALVAVLLVKLLVGYVDDDNANILGAVFFVLRPKIIQTFEYSNMMVVFSTLLFIFFSLHCINQRENVRKNRILKYMYIYCSALCLCLSILSYPSTIILYIVVIALLFVYADEKWACFLRFTGFCVLFGLLYFLYILDGRSITDFVEILFDIFKNDSHSMVNIYTGVYYWIGIMISVGLLAVSGIVAKLASLSVYRKSYGSTVFNVAFSLTYSVLLLVERYILDRYGDYYQMGSWSVHFSFILLPAVIGFCGVKRLLANERLLYISGLCIGIATIASVCILTNLPLHTVLGYGVLLAIVSCIPIVKCNKNSGRIVAICLLIVCILGTGFPKLTSMNYIRKGPLKYIVAPIEQCNKYKTSYDEWNNNITSEDVVFIPQTFGFDATFYMYTEAGVGAASTISTPYYGELLDRYWEKYPEKEPTVMAVFAWDGVERIDVPEWLVNKIYNEYEISSSEEYWNFYRKR